MKYYDSIDVCRQIRSDHAEERIDAGKGKKCPGGYWIPANKQCGKPGQAGKSGRMRSPGGGKMARNLAIGAAGTLALGAGGAALAYKNRDKIIAGVDKAGSAIRSGAKKVAAHAKLGIEQHQAKSQEEEMKKQKLSQQVSGAERGISRATGMASRAARSAASGAEGFVGNVKSGIKKAKETFGNIVSSGSKDKDKK